MTLTSAARPILDGLELFSRVRLAGERRAIQRRAAEVRGIGRRIRRWRGDRPVADVCKLVGVTERAWENWESGAHAPTQRHRRLLAGLGLTIPGAPAVRGYVWRGRWRPW